MKTYKNLYPRIWAYDNLYAACRAAARRKRRLPGVAGFEYVLTDSLFRLEEELRTQTYRPSR
jgi:RNA-directed DNA polymerase